jgi:hypothetical protein
LATNKYPFDSTATLKALNFKTLNLETLKP